MNLVLLTSILFVVAVAFVMVGLTVGASVLASRLVGRRHRDLESIVESGDVPVGWRATYERRISGLQRDPRNADRVARMREEARCAYLKRLDGLIHYAESSELVDTEETRRTLLDKLSAVREAWDRRGDSD